MIADDTGEISRLLGLVRPGSENAIIGMTPATQLLVVDIEATCWQGDPPAGEVSEIIEIGLAQLDLRTFEVGDKRSILVRPERSAVSSFCTELTTLTPEMVAAGLSLRDACALLEDEHRSRTRVWASYGDYDRRMFQEACSAAGVRYPFGPTHMNVKTAVALARGRSPVGMRGALDVLGLPLTGTHHRGDDDAWNTARILASVLREGRGAFQSVAAREAPASPTSVHLTD